MVIKKEIIIVIEVVSRLMHQWQEVHWESDSCIISYVRRSPSKGLLCKKHRNIELRSSQHRSKKRRKSPEIVVSQFSEELSIKLWLVHVKWSGWKHYCGSCRYEEDGSKLVPCDNKLLSILVVCFMRGKHIEIDCHFACDAITDKLICTS